MSNDLIINSEGKFEVIFCKGIALLADLDWCPNYFYPNFEPIYQLLCTKSKLHCQSSSLSRSHRVMMNRIGFNSKRWRCFSNVIRWRTYKYLLQRPRFFQFILFLFYLVQKFLVFFRLPIFLLSKRACVWIFKEALNIWKHFEKGIFVEKLVNDFIVASRIVEQVPERVFKVDQQLI